jgi:hypothetical protein
LGAQFQKPLVVHVIGRLTPLQVKIDDGTAGKHFLGRKANIAAVLKKSLVKIGEPSYTRRFASDRGEFSPNGVAILEFGPGRVSLHDMTFVVPLDSHDPNVRDRDYLGDERMR